MTYDFDYSSYDTTAGAAASAFGTGYMIGYLIVCVLLLVAMWKIFTKAGEAGWKSIIPIYNVYTMVQLFWNTDHPGLMTLLTFVPIANIIVAFILLYKMCQAFGKGVGFFLLMLFFSPIALLILAFGSADYLGPQ